MSLQSGKPIVIIANVPLSCPFGAGTYQGDGTETRLTIDFGQLETLEVIFRGLDEQLITAAIAAKDSLWPGKALTPEQVRENYTSPLKERESYNTTLRCKIDTLKIRVWSWEGAKIPLPGSGAKGCQVSPCIQVQSLWFMAPRWGATFQVTDLRIQEPILECPW